MASPFTFTPGMAGEAYIDMHYADEIADNFNSPDSEKYVYKILGLRGAGKSVVYSYALKALKQKPDWLVYTVSSGGDPLKTLIGLMSKETFIPSYEKNVTFSADASAEGNIRVLRGTGTVSAEVEQTPNQHYYSDEAAIKEMIAIASKKGYKILVGIDDIAKTKEMASFLSIIGDMVLDDALNVYLLCTGTSKNIEDFADEPHLSFFVRGDKIEIKRLSTHQMVVKYMELLHIPQDKAKELAIYTCGYAYAYQVLGELCYKYKTTDIKKIEQWFDASMADQYDIIWSQLSETERDFVKAVVNSESKAAKDIQNSLNHSANYSVIRSRLNKKHIINTDEPGILTVDLPRFREYLKMWQA